MNIYLDELPKNCWECPCFRNDIDFPCGLGDGIKDYFLDEIDGGECPLKSIAEHDQQVRKEVCEEIKKSAVNQFEFVICDECYNTVDNDVYISSVALTEILDQMIDI